MNLEKLTELLWVALAGACMGVIFGYLTFWVCP